MILSPVSASRLWTSFKIFLGFSSAIASFSGLWWYGSTQHKPEPVHKYMEESRNYAMIPFDMIDAQNICEIKTRARYGTALVRTSLDYHSTRVENTTGMYKIFLFADLGDTHIYDEALIHCFVNPHEYMVEHYQVFESGSKSLMERAKSLFNF